MRTIINHYQKLYVLKALLNSTTKYFPELFNSQSQQYTVPQNIHLLLPQKRCRICESDCTLYQTVKCIRCSNHKSFQLGVFCDFVPSNLGTGNFPYFGLTVFWPLLRLVYHVKIDFTFVALSTAACQLSISHFRSMVSK